MYIWHDGFGKFYPTVIVPLWRAFHLLRAHEGSVVSLLAFPRITIEMFRVKPDDIALARQTAEWGLGHRS